MTVNLLATGTYTHIHCPVANAAGNEIDSFDLKHLTTCIPDPGSAGSVTNFFWAWYRSVLAQAAAIWGDTAGRMLTTNTTDWFTLLPHGSYNVTPDWLQFVDLALGGETARYPTYGTDFPAGEYGTFAFTYEGYAEPWQRITFREQRMFPRYPRATGFVWWLKDGVLADANGHLRSPDALSIEVDAVGELDLATDIETALVTPNEAVIPFGNSRATNIKYAVTVDGALRRLTSGNSTCNGPTSPDLVYRTEYTHLLINSYLSEAWQQTSAPDSGFTQEELVASGNGIYTFAGGRGHSAKLQCTGGADDGSTFVGKPPFRYFGVAAFNYEGFYGPLFYLNTVAPLIRPIGLGATGFWYALKPGIEMSALFEVTPRAVLSAQSGLGEINLAAGVTTGLG